MQNKTKNIGAIVGAGIGAISGAAVGGVSATRNTNTDYANLTDISRTDGTHHDVNRILAGATGIPPVVDEAFEKKVQKESVQKARNFQDLVYGEPRNDAEKVKAEEDKENNATGFALSALDKARNARAYYERELQQRQKTGAGAGALIGMLGGGVAGAGFAGRARRGKQNDDIERG